jgi:hypothetical protein
MLEDGDLLFDEPEEEISFANKAVTKVFFGLEETEG